MHAADSAARSNVTKYTVRSKLPTCAKPVLKGTIKQEREQHLYARNDHTQLAGHLLQIAIQTFKARLPALRATGTTLAIGMRWLSVGGHHNSLPAVTAGEECS